MNEGVDSTLVTFHNATKGTVPNHEATGAPKPSIPQRAIRKFFGPPPFEIKEERIRKLKIPRFDLFTNPEGLVDVLKHPVVRAADVINLHWVARFVDYKSFFTRCTKPIVWTLHDMNGFTGGCHYSMGCEKFTSECFECPQLQPSSEGDLAKENFWIKKHALEHAGKMQIVAPSQWLVDCAARSAMFKPFNRQLIRYGLDTSVFRDHDREAARCAFNIPRNVPVLLFVSDYLDNERKGIRLFLQAIASVVVQNPDLVCCFIGHKGAELTKTIRGSMHLGRIEEPGRMALAFAAADVFALPSLQDNLPNTMLESLCCGTPVVAFNSGGTAEIIRDHANGFIGDEKNADWLARALAEALKHHWNRAEISREAREMFQPGKQARKYIELYSRVLARG
jgi:glycosyltransferase involved in cell wall biosynthesis